MKSNISTQTGTYSEWSFGRNGNSSYTDPARQWAYRSEFNVTNGLLKGDRKAPNPISYGRSRTNSQSWFRYSLLSGYPSMTHQYTTSNANGAYWSINQQGNLYLGLSKTAAARDQALRKIFDQMRYGSGNLVVDLAEARETIRMLKNAASVRKVAKEFVRGLVIPRNYQGSRRLKYASDKWLEYRYGWLPFLSSTYELLKTLSKKIDSRTVVSVEGKATFESEFVKYHDFEPSYSGGRRVAFDVVKHSNRCLIDVRMRARSTMEIYDFTSLNPLGIAWELLPLSFVADWFVNVGDCLSLWEDYIIFANRFVSGFQTETFKQSVIFEDIQSFNAPTPVYPNGQQMNDFVVGYYERKAGNYDYLGKDRIVLDTLPTPGGIRVEVKLNPQRLLDAAALIRGAFGNPKLK